MSNWDTETARQMTIFDFIPKEHTRTITSKCMGCKYHYFRHGKTTGIGCELSKEYPCKFTPRHNCGTCKYFGEYVCGLGDIYHGTHCKINAPFAVNVEAEDEACDKWEQGKAEIMEGEAT